MTELWRFCMTAIMKVPVMKSKNLYSILTKIVLYLPQQEITRILIKLK